MRIICHPCATSNQFYGRAFILKSVKFPLSFSLHLLLNTGAWRSAVPGEEMPAASRLAAIELQVRGRPRRPSDKSNLSRDAPKVSTSTDNFVRGQLREHRLSVGVDQDRSCRPALGGCHRGEAQWSRRRGMSRAGHSNHGETSLFGLSQVLTSFFFYPAFFKSIDASWHELASKPAPTHTHTRFSLCISYPVN